MNRAERRRGKWAKIVPHKDYDGLLAEVGEDSRKLLMTVLRELVGPGAPFDDRQLWNSTRELITAGLLNVYFRFGADGIEIRPELLIPPQNDNFQPIGAA